MYIQCIVLNGCIKQYIHDCVLTLSVLLTSAPFRSRTFTVSLCP